MFDKRNSLKKVPSMGCFRCFGLSFIGNPKKAIRPSGVTSNKTYRGLLNDNMEEKQDGSFHNGDLTNNRNRKDFDFLSPIKRSEEILMYRMQNGLICRGLPVKETHNAFRSEVGCVANAILTFITSVG